MKSIHSDKKKSKNKNKLTLFFDFSNFLLGNRSSSQNSSVCVKTKSNNFLIPPVARIYGYKIRFKTF